MVISLQFKRNLVNDIFNNDSVPRIKDLVKKKKNQHVSVATNTSMWNATGSYERTYKFMSDSIDFER